MDKFKRHFPALLLGIYLVEGVVLGIAPYHRAVWLAENLTALIPVLFLALMYWRGIRFSNLAYLLAAVYFWLQTIGGHYTFERVPCEWLTELGHFQRNHFDRICHFLVGTFAYMTLEYLEQRQLIRSRPVAVFFTVMGIFGFAAVFEIIEWLYAVGSDPTAGSAFLGSQGDPWDAQKDMLADGLGAMFFSALYLLRHRRAAATHRSAPQTGGGHPGA